MPSATSTTVGIDRMRGETWVSWAVCLFGATVPLAWVGAEWPVRPVLLMSVAVAVAVLPFAAVAGTAWAARRDRRAARTVAVVAVLVLAVGLVGWGWADRDGEGLILAALLLVPSAQFLVWLGGAIVSGRRADWERPS